jgi:hypothetical protein
LDCWNPSVNFNLVWCCCKMSLLVFCTLLDCRFEQFFYPIVGIGISVGYVISAGNGGGEKMSPASLNGDGDGDGERFLGARAIWGFRGCGFPLEFWDLIVLCGRLCQSHHRLARFWDPRCGCGHLSVVAILRSCAPRLRRRGSLIWISILSGV